MCLINERLIHCGQVFLLPSEQNGKVATKPGSVQKQTGKQQKQEPMIVSVHNCF